MKAFEAIQEDRVVAVVRASSVVDPLGLVKVLSDAGIRCVEFTFTIPGALELIREAASAGALVGAGTVVSARQAEEGIRAGASFVVAPALVSEIVAPCREAGVPAFPAAFTPTEVLAAIRAGATGVKLFPASVGGARYLQDLLGPFPDAALLPSGGVNAENARSFLDAGAVAVFAGSALVPAPAAEQGDLEDLRRRAEAFVAALH